MWRSVCAIDLSPPTGRTTAGYLTLAPEFAWPARHSRFELIDHLGIPVVTGFNRGRLGSDGARHVCRQAGHHWRSVRKLCGAKRRCALGAWMPADIWQISYAWSLFARAAYKIVVDIDEAELRKPTIKPDMPVHADAGAVLRGLLQIAANSPRSSSATQADWLSWCKARLAKYPVVLPEYWGGLDRVNPYCFAQRLFELVRDDEIIVTGDATACIVTFQAANIRTGMRLFSDSGCVADGIRPSRGDWGLYRCRQQTCGLSGRRWQHHDEPSGAANDRRPGACRSRFSS